MSSFMGHAGAGAAAFLAAYRWRNRGARVVLPAAVALAMAPDIDYLALWLFQARGPLRLTHSLLFCLAAALLVWWLLPRVAGMRRDAKLLLVLSAAACSHLLLDWLVGVHGLPLWWPLEQRACASPIGVLPSAGRVDVGNRYFWRNLLIECGVLWPVLLAVVALCRGVRLRTMLRAGLPVLAAWAVFVAWSVSLSR
ncbi:MAG: metal-dependent hydrolase [Aquabacterium sp.]|nr:MAG: metal-dependent hydrolase [Aquabacterium sp.]